MGITLDGQLDPDGQVVESIHLGGSPGYERQVSALGGWDNVNEKVAVKAADPGNAAYGLTVRALPRMTTNPPSLERVTDTDTAVDAFDANPDRIHYSVENDDDGGEGFVYVNEGADASPTAWVSRLSGGERWAMEVWTGERISVYVTGSAVAQCNEWVP